MTRDKACMPNVVFYDLIVQAKNLGAETISIFGFGEPLMDEQLAWKVKECSHFGLNTFVTTNASLLTAEKSRALLEAGLSHIRFSVHGITARDYEKVHKGLKFFPVIYNMAKFVQLNEDDFNKSCKISVTVIPMHGELIDSIKDFWESGIDYLEIWRPHGWGGKRIYRKPLKEKKKTMCERPFSGPVQIQADGRVIPCCFITDAEIVLGDIYKDTIEDILKGKLYEELRDRHRQGDLKGLPCETCDQMYVYNKSNSPLLYSSRDIEMNINVTSSTKFKLEAI